MKFATSIRQFIMRPFIHDSLILQFGSFFSTGVAILASIVFARFLGVAAYGEYALLGTLVGVLTMFTDVGADGAALTQFAQARERQDAKESGNVLAAYVKTNMIFIIGVGVILILLAPWIAERLYHNSHIGQYAQWWLTGNMFLIFSSLLVVVLQGRRAMKALVVFEGVSDTTKAVLKVVPVVLGLSLAGLVYGYVAAAFGVGVLGVLWYARISKSDPCIPALSVLVRKAFHVSLRKFMHFGILISLNKNFYNFLSLLPLLFLGRFAPPAIAGFYKIAFSYVTLPFVLLGGVSRLMGIQFPQSRVHGIAVLRRNFIKSSVYAGLIGIALIIPAVLLAPMLVRLFYGPEFMPVVKIIYPLSLAVLPIGFSIGFGSLFRALDKVHIGLVLQTVQLAGAVLVALVCFHVLTPLRIVIAVQVFWNFIGLFTGSIVAHYYLKREECTDTQGARSTERSA